MFFCWVYSCLNQIDEQNEQPIWSRNQNRNRRVASFLQLAYTGMRSLKSVPLHMMCFPVVYISSLVIHVCAWVLCSTTLECASSVRNSSYPWESLFMLYGKMLDRYHIDIPLEIVLARRQDDLLSFPGMYTLRILSFRSAPDRYIMCKNIVKTW